MSSRKEKKRLAKKRLQDARSIIFCMENYLNDKEDLAFDIATAFFHILDYHFSHGDLRPHLIHLAALLRKDNEI